jgi:MarR family transcriptional regulator, organic hydroperoxide resistance regulator
LSRRNPPERTQRTFELPPSRSSGYLVRDAHRAFQRVLERRIARFGVTRGHWYFLRVLWIEDGLTQRELSARVGMMEPTTVIALKSMENAGLVRRVRSREDARRAHVWLTPLGRRLERQLLPVALQIVREAEKGIGRRNVAVFQEAIAHMTRNLDRLED